MHAWMRPGGRFGFGICWLRRFAGAIIASVLVCGAVSAQVAFTAQDDLGLPDGTLDRPTSLQFGPDGRLYVSEQDGTIQVFIVMRDSAGEYTGFLDETITLVEGKGASNPNGIPNHQDDGSDHVDTRRQVTGLLVTGTPANPVLYVTSSDPRIGGKDNGVDKNLDTNSGIISRLTWNGSSWERVNIVRGLPRSEENHSTNGMALDKVNNILYVAQGGNANKAAPSNNLAGLPEYYLSGAILKVDLDAIEAIETANGGPFVDQDTGHKFVYDLHTLNDPSRIDIGNGHPEFPYGSRHPRFNDMIDLGDPFGGNEGLNQAIPKAGEPVQIYSPGYRNIYDVVLTSQGRLYGFDNGPNGSWGGPPFIYEQDGTFKGHENMPGVEFDAADGEYCTNEFNDDVGPTGNDFLHYVDQPGYYGGHPNPIRAFPDKAGIIVYEKQQDGDWAEVRRENFFNLLPAGFSQADFPTHPIQCDYSRAERSMLEEGIEASTNGITEYTASNFGGAMQGDLLAASFNGNVYRFQLNTAGDDVTAQEALFSGLGGFNALDVTAQGDNEIFPGTVWVALYGAGDIAVFEPTDAGTCSGTDDDTIDEDGDQYTNADEIDNGTSPCNAGSVPNDHDGTVAPDGFKDSDLNDPDDDDDGIPDVSDPFALDAANGTNTGLPVDYPFFNGDPGTGLFGLGFTGLMVPENGTTTWLDLYDPATLAAGGTSGIMTVEQVTAGTAKFGANTQDNGFLFGVDVDVNTAPFVVHTRLQSPYFDSQTPQDAQSFGLFIGTGDQDRYLKIVFNANGGNGGIVVAKETSGSVFVDTQYDNSDWGNPNILSSNQVDLYLTVDPEAATVQPSMSLNQGTTVFDLGSPVDIPSSWLAANDGQGLAVGLISTSTGPGDPFAATWDFMRLGAPACFFGEDFVTVSNETINTDRNIAACIGLTLGPDVHIVNGAKVAARAGERVQIGTGFRVEQGAEFSIAIDP